MNIFTVNQVNQVYVLKADSTVTANTPVKGTSTLGSLGVKQTPDQKAVYFQHLGAGGLTRSDLIKKDSVMYITKTPAKAMERKTRVAVVTLNAEAIANEKPISGEDYVLKIKFDNVLSLSPENQYWKYGVVHSTATMTESDFYATLAKSVATNMSREAVKLVEVGVVTSNDPVEVTANTDISTIEGATGVYIKELEQDWILGVKQQRPLSFTLETDIIYDFENDEKPLWGDVVYSDGQKTIGGVNPTTAVASAAEVSALPAGDVITNGKLAADFEYFFMGERADQYRMVNFPDYIPTTYLVDPTQKYDYITIHYAYTGSNHAVQKSEKDITFLVPTTSNTTELGTLGQAFDAILGQIFADK